MLKRLLITGAAGGLGTAMRPRLAHLAEDVRISDMVGMEAPAPNEEAVICDLSDKAAVMSLVEGCDGVVHFGGRSVEDTWDVIRASNIEGMVNLYEAARKTGKPRIVFASSNHAIGFYPQTERLDADAPTRPDGFYGVSKVFGEALASMYHDKFGIETASVRIGSCLAEPKNHRMLATWMSFDDFAALIARIFEVETLGCPIIYGASDNDAGWWDNSKVGHLGWSPKDNAEVFRAKLDAAMARPGPDDPTVLYQGGTFATDGIHED